MKGNLLKASISTALLVLVLVAVYAVVPLDSRVARGDPVPTATGTPTAAATVTPTVTPTPTVSAPPEGTVSIGSAVFPDVVELQALDVTSPGLGAWTIDITYDPSVVFVLNCAPGAGGHCSPEFDSDTIRVTGASATGLEGDTTLATIQLFCVAAGVSPLTLYVQVFADATVGDPQDINPTVVDGSYTCPEGLSPSVEVDATAGNLSGFFGTVEFPLPGGSPPALGVEVVLSTPLPSVDYAVLLTPVGLNCAPRVTAKTANGFSFTCFSFEAGSVDWAVIVGLAPGAPSGPGAPPGGGPPGGPPGGP